MTDPLAFAMAVVALLAAPGPTNALLAIAGATGGWRAAPAALAATLSAYLVAIGALSLALAPLAAHLPAALTALRLICAVYLMVVSAKLWRSSYRPDVARQPLGARAIFTTTLLNPKGLILATGVFPTGLGLAGLTPYYIGFSTLCLVASLGWLALGAFASAISQTRTHGLIRRIGAIALAGFSGALTAMALG